MGDLAYLNPGVTEHTVEVLCRRTETRKQFKYIFQKKKKKKKRKKRKVFLINTKIWLLT